ncbi:tRNA modification GTPase trmE [Pricia antarctica]|uniref:tRNA modification GTPase MnmE n=1 Tax=Pricia antarctica TaxID=641691 RepID=A0A1G7B775_9FLAO|nr:tRNA uridine-5-carboxymethylaminomethyl(34) synthesis GTPase MnmE [Pricia antarctica]SDE22156.1 tRNA modification GTPase trmE [Pricia antarctica]
MIPNDSIIALATPSGAGAIAVIRISGSDAIAATTPFFKSIHGKKLVEQKSHTIVLGHIVEGKQTLDEVLVSIFKAPNSYTGENVVEISCHGSPYIQQQIIQLFLRNGCRMADAGEFTLRAFLNGKMDLSQAEAVADLIASDNAASHQIAIQQMRGGFSNEIKNLREELLNFASLIELELDFAEEDVEFANRNDFKALIDKIQKVLKRLIDSFAVGNVIKNGIPVAIVGEPNVGKSTLLNALLNEERALVSEIAGTTRDTIEDEISIGGIGFRFIDTAGIRETEDVIEGMGIKRTFEKIGKSEVTLYLFDASAVISAPNEQVNSGLKAKDLLLEIKKIKNKYPQKPLVLVANKIDRLSEEEISNLESQFRIPFEEVSNRSTRQSDLVLLSAKTGQGVEELQSRLLQFVNTGALRNNETIVTNTRHYNALLKALEEIDKVQLGIDEELPSDLMAIDVREALYHLGEITGQVTNDELLGNIFANFCIGK